MLKPVKDHQKVDDAYFQGKNPTVTYHFSCTPTTLWKALVDSAAWTEWLDGLTSTEWTSAPVPHGIGTTRTVRVGDHQINETFFGWEEERRMAFYFNQSSLPIKAGAENYRIIETKEGCELQWTFRLSAIFPIKQLLFWQIKKDFRAGLPKLEKLMADNPVRFS